MNCLDFSSLSIAAPSEDSESYRPSTDTESYRPSTDTESYRPSTDTASLRPTSPFALARSCEELSISSNDERGPTSLLVGSPQTSADGGPRGRSVSYSRLDCSVHYSDAQNKSLSLQEEGVTHPSPNRVFSTVRDALMFRLCGGPTSAPPLPGSGHPRQHREPKRDFRGSSESCLRPSVSTGRIYPPRKNGVPSCSLLPGCNNNLPIKSSVDLTPRIKEMLLSFEEGIHRPKKSHSKHFYHSENSGHNGLEEEVHDVTANDRVVRRTQSDLFTKPPHKHLSCSDFSYRQQSLGRQYSSPQPIKLRPHHRLPNYNSVTTVQRNQRLKRSRASTHLRRSVSQPLDLDKSFQAQVSLHKMRTSDDDPPTERLRRPSVDNLLSDEITSEEEAGMSDCDESKPEFKFYLDEEEEMIVYAEALWDHVSLDSDELVFKAGDLITVVDSSDKDWWWGRIPPRAGWFPASFVRLLVNQEDHQNKSDHTDDPGIWNDRQLSISSLSQDEIRSNVINEILSTERDYVKHLKDVVEGYLKQVRKRPDMFCEESISTIFGNMEALFCFHTHFLAQLEVCIDFEEPHLSCIGDCFIRNKNRFEIYSEYCNNHPLAVSELQQLYQYQKYVHFFEACRLLQEMIDISLDGFLLTPVQKICKYPLQLQELLKYTQPSHRDFTSVHGAMQAMKEVALLVNERRRRMECLEKIATWQKSVEGWEGLDLLEDSSQLIHQGEVIKGVGTSWPKEVALFLFDHQLVYCKKDLLKRNTFVYRGRINTDLCEVFSIPFDPTRSAALQNTWKIHCLHKNKTYVFSCKTPAEKQKWLTAFKRERELVAIDETSGFVASEKQKQVARLAARNQKSKPKKPKMKSHKRTQAMTYAQAHLLVNDGEIRSNSLPLRGSQEAKKKGLWFSFGGHKKSRGSNRNAKHNSLQND